MAIPSLELLLQSTSERLSGLARGHQSTGSLFCFLFNFTFMSFFNTNFASLFPKSETKITVFFSKKEISSGPGPFRYFIEEEGLHPDQWATPDGGYGALVNLIGQGYLRCLCHLGIANGSAGEESAILLRELVTQMWYFFYANFGEIESLLAADKKVDFLGLIKNKDNVGNARFAFSFIEESICEVAQKDTLDDFASIGYKTAINGAVTYHPSFYLADKPAFSVLSFLSILQKTINRLNNPLAFALFLEYVVIANINLDQFGYNSISKLKQLISSTNEVVRGKVEEGLGLHDDSPVESFIAKHIDEYPFYVVAIPKLH